MSDSSGEILLVAAVIHSAIDSEGVIWLQGECGRFWCDVGGLDPKAVWREHFAYAERLRKLADPAGISIGVPPYRARECKHRRSDA